MHIDASSLATLGGGIALAGGLAGSSLGIAVSACAGAAMLGQEPKQLRNVIILAALPMSRAFYAFIFLILILTSVLPGLASGQAPEGSGFAVFAVGLIAASAFGFSGAFQGAVPSAGGLSSAFEKIGITPSQASKFVPALTDYVSTAAGRDVGMMLANALK